MGHFVVQDDRLRRARDGCKLSLKQVRVCVSVTQEAVPFSPSFSLIPPLPLTGPESPGPLLSLLSQQSLEVRPLLSSA